MGTERLGFAADALGGVLERFSVTRGMSRTETGEPCMLLSFSTSWSLQAFETYMQGLPADDQAKTAYCTAPMHKRVVPWVPRILHSHDGATLV